MSDSSVNESPPKVRAGESRAAHTQDPGPDIRGA